MLTLGFFPEGLQASNILIDTWETDSLENMDMETRKRVVSAETGIMDTLFDEGHIFFNTYSVPAEDRTLPSFSDSLKLAVEIGAEYLVRLDPDETGLGWKVIEIEGQTTRREGYLSIQDVDSSLSTVERWTLLGLNAGKDILAAVE